MEAEEVLPLECSNRLFPPPLPPALLSKEKKPESSLNRARFFLKLAPVMPMPPPAEILLAESMALPPLEDAEEEVEEEVEEEWLLLRRLPLLLVARIEPLEPMVTPSNRSSTAFSAARFCPSHRRTSGSSVKAEGVLLLVKRMVNVCRGE